jgi:hypothetical protein
MYEWLYGREVDFVGVDHRGGKREEDLGGRVEGGAWVGTYICQVGFKYRRGGTGKLQIPNLISIT